MTNYDHENYPCPQGVLGKALDHLVPVDEKERASAKTSTKKLLVALLGDSYKAFIKRLKISAHDPKVLALIKSGLRDGEKKEDAATLTASTPKVSNLRPSQSEIDIDKSLKWPLTDETTARKCLDGKAVEIMGPIIVFRNTTIVDGHHRWSQIYACNAKATVKAENLVLKGKDPIDALKAVQMAIAATIKDVPSEQVKGTNLLKAGEKTIKAYVIKTLKEELIPIYAAAGAGTTKEEIANYIWGNVQVMQKKSQPIKGAPDRGLMPQTDQAPGWDKTLKTGKVNHAPPFVKESRDEDADPITLREQLVGHAFPAVDLPVVRAYDDLRREVGSDLMGSIEERKDQPGLIDTLTNSMEHFESEREFVDWLRELGFKSSEAKRVWKAYLKISAVDRHRMNDGDWIEFLSELGVSDSRPQRTATPNRLREPGDLPSLRRRSGPRSRSRESIEEGLPRITRAIYTEYALTAAKALKTYYGALRPSAVAKFITSNSLSVLDFSKRVESGEITPSEMASLVAGRPGNPIQKKVLAMVKRVDEESIEEAAPIDQRKLLALYDRLKKGDKLDIVFDSTMSKGSSMTFVVTSPHRVVGKEKVGRIILQSVDNLRGVKYFWYNRGGKISMAQGDMGVSMISAEKSTSESIEETKRRRRAGPSQNTRADLAARFGKQSGNYVEATEKQRAQAVEKLLKFTKHSARVTEDNYNELARRAVADYIQGDLMAETARSMGKALAYMDKFKVDYDKDSIPQYARDAMQMLPESIEEGRGLDESIEEVLNTPYTDAQIMSSPDHYYLEMEIPAAEDPDEEASDRESDSGVDEQLQRGSGGGMGMATASGIPTSSSRVMGADNTPGSHGVYYPGFEGFGGGMNIGGGNYAPASPVGHGGGGNGNGGGQDPGSPFYSPDPEMVLVYDREGKAHYMKPDQGTSNTSPTVINVNGGTANITVNEETTEFPTEHDIAFAEQVMNHIREHGRSNISSISQALNVEPDRLAGVVDRMKREDILLDLGGGMVSLPEKEPEPKQDNIDPATSRVVGSEVTTNESLDEMRLGDLFRGFYKKLQKGRKVKPDPQIAEILGADVTKAMSLKGMTQDQIKTLAKYLRGDYRESQTTQVSFARSDAPDFLRIARAVGISESAPLTVAGDRFVLEAPSVLAFMLDEEVVECSA